MSITNNKKRKAGKYVVLERLMSVRRTLVLSERGKILATPGGSEGYCSTLLHKILRRLL